MAKGDRNLGWPGFFRAFTVLCAIMLLLAQSGQQAVTAGSGDWQVLSVYEGLTSWSIPALFMLWGMFALEEGKPHFTSSMLGLVLPAFGLLVFWGALYAVVTQILGDGILSWRGVWAALLSAAQGNTYYHLWVLYPLIGLYLVHPVLHRFTSSSSRGEIRYFLILCFLFASVVPMWGAFHPNSVIVSVLERLRIHLVLGWVGCYVGGWYLRHYIIGRIPEFILYILGVLGMVLTLMGNNIFGGGRELWYLYTAPNVVLTAAAFCTLFRYVLGISEERSRRRAVNQLGAYAFGVYLFHQIWVLVLRWFGVSFQTFSPVVSVPLFALILFLLSAPFAWLLSLIPGVGPKLT
ncbi:MAG: acyltransferase [Lawsonibacter sp.]